jgi:hypothetical protein
MIASAKNLRLEQASLERVQIGGNGKGLLQKVCGRVLESRGMKVHNHREKFRKRLQSSVDVGTPWLALQEFLGSRWGE